jgi:hypothetical protein
MALTPTSMPKLVNGVPTRRYLKEAIRVGEYQKDGEGFNVTADDIAGWVKTFHEMTANGVKVSVPSMHTAVGIPELNMGYVLDMFVEGESLMCVVELVGEKAIEAASKSDVSICFEPFVDGKGTRYESAITHLAMVTDPLVPGMKRFISLAASIGKRSNSVDWKIIKEALNIEEDVTDENAIDLIKGVVTKLQARVAELEDKLKESEKDEKDEKGEANKNSSKAVAASMAASPSVVRLVAEGRRAKLNKLVADGKITPAVRVDLEQRYVGKGEESVKRLLSLSDEADADDGFDHICDALAKNESAVKVNGRSALCVDPNKSDNPLLADAKRRAANKK